jgi:AcrR family transcriptional regulator
MSQTRPYRLRRRAERQAATRARIVEAAVDMHTSLGPAATSISAIAERAGVQRHTVYAHFPDDDALFSACTGHWRSLHPFPDPAAWTKTSDPRRRLRRALQEIYAWYAEVEDDFALFTRDSHVFPSFWAAGRAQFSQIADDLARGFPRRKAVRAAVGHALDFGTWRSLVRGQGLSDSAAVALMVGLVESA